MNRRGLLATLTMALLVCGAFTPGLAASAPAVTHQAWVNTGPVMTFLPQANQIYSATHAGTEQAQAYVRLAVDDPAAPSLRDAALVLTEGSDTLLPSTATLAACALAQPLTHSGQLAQPIATDCRHRVQAVRGPNATWRVPLGVFLPDSLAHGLALLPDIAGAPDTWRLAFDTTKTTLAGEAPPGASTPSPTSPQASAGIAQPTLDSRPVPTAAIAGALPGEPAPTVVNPPQYVAPTPGAAGAAVAAVEQPRPASQPSALLVFGLLAALAMLALAVMWKRQPRSARSHLPVGSGGQRGLATCAAVAMLLGLGGLPEASLYKAGLVIIVIIAAIGLHILVNWAGELSLAHAGFVGVPAFSVAALASHHHLSPVYLLPLGILVGAALGGVVGLPSLRTKGLQVALATLAAGLAINSYLFTQTWLVGPPGGANVPLPRLGPISLGTTRSLYFFLVAAFVVAIVAARMLFHSKLGRGLFWLRSQPAAAAAFGVPVARYKLLAYILAGSFAGLAGGLTVVWVQQLTPNAFPPPLSFTYLLIVVLAGRGSLGGVIVAAAFLEGGRQFIGSAGPFFAYAGPIGLLIILTRNRAGLNGIGAQLMSRIRDLARNETPTSQATRDTSTPNIILFAGWATIVAGFSAIALAWYHSGNTDQLWIQNQEILSGGLGGLALVLVGVGLLIRDSHCRLADRIERALGHPAESTVASFPPEPGGGAVLNDTIVPDHLDDTPDDRRPRKVNGDRRKRVPA